MLLLTVLCRVWSVRGRLGVCDAILSAISSVQEVSGVCEEMSDAWFVDNSVGAARFDVCSAFRLDGDKNLERVEGIVEVCLVRGADRGDADVYPWVVLSRNVQVSGTTVKT